MANNKAPGNDLIIPFWIKRLTSLHPILLNLYTSTKSSETEIPDWLAISRTILQPKNVNTHMAKNYRPIACLNIMYKLYTGIINQFIDEHCSSNSIIAVEQAGGKRGSWGCSEQLLINKMILNEVREHKRNIFTMWFDYKKAFDSIPRQWLLEALKLAKLPADLIKCIETLTKK